MIINGKYFKVYTVDEEDLCYHRSLDEDDIGKSYIVLNGCIQFVTIPDEPSDWGEEE